MSPEAVADVALALAAATEDARTAREALRRCRDGAEIALGMGLGISPYRAQQVLRAIREAAVAVVGER